MIEQEPPEVIDLYEGLQRLLDTRDEQGRKIGNCQRGIYLFIDYDGEPIYVGQSVEMLRTRIRRHLTNQRTDSVAMSVLDPFEVAEIELWPFWHLEEKTLDEGRRVLRKAEFTIYCRALERSTFRAVLNEGKIPPAELIDLPESTRLPILTDAERKKREHPDIRIARRARTIANLARIISERRVKAGIRRTLLIQAQRLEHLAKQRLGELNAGEREEGK